MNNNEKEHRNNFTILQLDLVLSEKNITADNYINY